MKFAFILTSFLSFCLFTMAEDSASAKNDATQNTADQRIMMFGDTTRKGVPYSKDPHVVAFQDRYLIYYSVPAVSGKPAPLNGWGIGIAQSTNLIDWEVIGQITPTQPAEGKGICAPCARVIDGKVHLFYQSYGAERYDSICHASSTDGIHFKKDPTNPIFRPQSCGWTCGRAIDAEVVRYGDDYYLYYATRDPLFRIQYQGVARAKAVSNGDYNFTRGQWTNLSTEESILRPRLSWEGRCVEGASVIEKNGKLYMFYAGSYNNAPQQIGVAVSTDAVHWQRLSKEPFLKNGAEGEWNHSESGHPHIFEAPDGRTFLFYQGNNDNGKTWKLSNVEVFWDEKGPYLKK